MKRVIALMMVTTLFATMALAQRGGGDDRGEGRDDNRRRSDNGASALITPSGQAIVMNFDVVETETEVTINQEINAYDESGAVVWSNNFEGAQLVRGMRVVGDNLLLTLGEPRGERPEGDEGEGEPREIQPVTLSMVDAASGAEIWTLTVTGKVSGVNAAGDGWYLQYSTSDGTTFSKHLAYIDASGAIAWDQAIQTREIGDR